MYRRLLDRFDLAQGDHLDPADLACAPDFGIGVRVQVAQHSLIEGGGIEMEYSPLRLDDNVHNPGGGGQRL